MGAEKFDKIELLEKIKQTKELLDMGAITQEEFETIKLNYLKELNKVNDEINVPIVGNALVQQHSVDEILDVYKINDVDIYVGKIDNLDVLDSILFEKNFYAIFIETSQHNGESWLDMLNVVVKYNPEVIVLFFGLDDTYDIAIQRVNSLDYMGNIITVNSLDELIDLVAIYSHEEAILISGNNQDIIEIQERIKLISEKLKE